MSRQLRSVVLCLGLALGCAGKGAIVTRVADGVVYSGRFIAPEAYREYALGAYLEARGDRAGARQAFELALDADPGSPEILARIGRLECQGDPRPPMASQKRAAKAFRDALHLDPNHSVALSELARCRARLGEPQAALQAALSAARADPDSIGVQLLTVQLAQAAGQIDLARRWLDALVTRSPGSRPAWLAMASFATRHADSGRALRARQALNRLHIPPDPSARRDALNQALAAGDLERARRIATRSRIAAGELAARAALAGAWPLAREQAELVLAADPTDSDAWIALMAFSDLTRDFESWTDTLRAAPDKPATLPTPTSRKIHGQLLERIAGPEAKRAWDGAF